MVIKCLVSENKSSILILEFNDGCLISPYIIKITESIKDQLVD